MAQLMGAARSLRQKRGVQVHAAPVSRQRGRRKDLPIIAGHQQIGPKAGQPRHRRRCIDILGIENLGAVLLGDVGIGDRLHWLAAMDSAARDQRHDGVAGIVERAERRHGERPRAQH